MKIAGVLALTFAAIVTAEPATSAKTTAYTATFDDLPGVTAVSELSPVGTYHGLMYHSFNVLVQGIKGVVKIGIKPQSGDQTIANGITDSVLKGKPSFVPGRSYTSFDLDSLYFACVINSVESAVGVPEQCTIAFTAYLPNSKIAFQTINQQFRPSSPVLAKMGKAVFPKTWNKLGRVTVAVVQSTTSSTLTGLLIDNVQYTLNK